MLDNIPLIALTPSALLGIAILLIITGGLWTNKAYQQKVRECEKWEKAFQKSEEARSLESTQNKELLEVGKATYHILDAVFNSLEPPGRGGAHRVVHQTSR